MRLAADGRHLTDLTVSDRFPKLAESLSIARKNQKEQIEMRASVNRKMAVKDA